MIHTFSASTHHAATHHSEEGGVVGFVESSLKKLWNGILYGAGHHIGYELAWVIAGLAIAAVVWLWAKKRRKNRAAARERDAAQVDATGSQTLGQSSQFRNGHR